MERSQASWAIAEIAKKSFVPLGSLCSLRSLRLTPQLALDLRDWVLYIRFVAPEICPQCGSQVPPNAKACPECGSDERTGWSEEALTAGLDLPDQEFNYEDFVEREFGGSRRVRPPGIPWFWWLVALGLAGAFLAFWFS